MTDELITLSQAATLFELKDGHVLSNLKTKHTTRFPKVRGSQVSPRGGKPAHLYSRDELSVFLGAYQEAELRAPVPDELITVKQAVVLFSLKNIYLLASLKSNYPTQFPAVKARRIPKKGGKPANLYSASDMAAFFDWYRNNKPEAKRETFDNHFATCFISRNAEPHKSRAIVNVKPYGI